MRRTTYKADGLSGPNVSAVLLDVPGGETSTTPVTLPHGAMLTLPRRASVDSGPSTGTSTEAP